MRSLEVLKWAFLRKCRFRLQMIETFFTLQKYYLASALQQLLVKPEKQMDKEIEDLKQKFLFNWKYLIKGLYSQVTRWQKVTVGGWCNRQGIFSRLLGMYSINIFVALKLSLANVATSECPDFGLILPLQFSITSILSMKMKNHLICQPHFW